MSFARRFLVIFVPLLFIPFAYSSPETDMFKNADSVSVSGSARIRWEVKDQLMDSNEKAEDKKDFIGSRFRLELKFEPDSKSTVYIQPQFTKFFGGVEPTTSGATSGSLQDTRLDIHQAYLDYSMSDQLSVRVGRQELAYGNHLVIGNVGWSHVSRSFDALRIRHAFRDNKGFVDGFWSQIEDVDTEATFNTDSEFSGLYFQYKGLTYVPALDFYVLHKGDESNVDPNPDSFFTFGTRAEFDFDPVAFDFEFTQQSEYESNQADINLSYNLDNIRIYAGYSNAHKDYQQIYPTGHKFLGSADLFGRRNIIDMRAGVNAKMWENKASINLEYHKFSRNDDKSPIYAVSGGGFAGSTGLEPGTEVASEADLSLRWNFSEKSHVVLGGAYVTPGEYLENIRGNNDNGHFVYLQTSTSF
ncbi:MAG: alginate export family protein [Pseudobdellovibrionaceae bacterium]|nr:MAG: alginate export family protein [Pseudobdellovibrionaceae bacterium]